MEIKKNKKLTFKTIAIYQQWLQSLYKTKNFSQVTRTNKKNLKEYNIDKFGKLKNDLKNYKISKYKDFFDIFIKNNNKILCYENNNFFYRTNNDYFKKNINLIAKEINSNVNKQTDIVELGAGYGRIALSLINKRIKFRNMYCYEFTSNGRELIKTLSKNLKYNIKVSSCDFNKKQIFKNSIPRQSIVYTYNSIMVVPKIKEVFFKQIIQLKPKIVLHFEPDYSKLSKDNKLDKYCKKYCEINNYNDNFYLVLEKLANQKKIEIIKYNDFIRRNPFVPSKMIAWRPIN